MFHRKSSTLFALLFLVWVAIITVAFNTPAQAQSIPTNGNENNCMKCHEDLYFLHDTGNWFCIRESPMLCVDCHGGDPKAITQEMAHIDRAAHPVMNEDVSKCQECHPNECHERVELFDQTAGLSQVLVAAPFLPAYSTENADIVTVDIPQQEQKPSSLIVFWEVVSLVLIAGLAMAIYFLARRRHN